MEIPVTLEQDKHKLWTHTDCLSGAQFEYCAVTLHKDYAMNMHAHSFYEVNIVIHGKGRHFIKNNYIDVEEKCMFVIPPYMEHGYYNVEQLDVLHILLFDGFLHAYGKEMMSLPGYHTLFDVEPQIREFGNEALFPVLDTENFEKVLQFITICQQNTESDYAGKYVIQNAAVLQLIGVLCVYMYKGECFSNRSRPSVQLMCSMEYIKNNCSQSLSVSALAGQSFLSKSTYMRNFKDLCGLSPMQYVRNCRLELGKRLLCKPELTIAQIAQDCGFFDASHFIKEFHEKYGASPNQYRKQSQ